MENRCPYRNTNHGIDRLNTYTAYRHTRIMTREQVIKFARSSKVAGGAVVLNGFINPTELDNPPE